YSKGTELSMQRHTKMQELIKKFLINKGYRRVLLKKIYNTNLDELYQNYINKKYAELDAGYASSGVVIEVGSYVDGFNVGDRVALSGEDANHEEFSLITPMMATKIPQGVSMIDAAFATLGAIALEGIRCLNLIPGDKVAVIGCGLIGQLGIRILKFYGFEYSGFDIDEEKIKVSKELGYDVRHIDEIEEFMYDACIIYADSNDSLPIKKGVYCLKKGGRLALTGNVPIEFDRDVLYFKGIKFQVSSSYGLGRYDPLYEVKGVDYPEYLAKNTIDRNKREFLRMLSNGLKIDFPYKVIPFENAENIDLSNVFTCVFEYQKEVVDKKVINLGYEKRNAPITVAIIGLGDFFISTHLRNFSKLSKYYRLKYLVSNRVRKVGLLKRYGIEEVTNDLEVVLKDSQVNLVFICSRHNRHALEVIKSIEAGKDVFVEKPLCISLDELNDIIEVFKINKSKVFVGFNRRYSKHTQILKSRLGFPSHIVYRINSNFPKDHWIFDRQVGGGVVIGEACHFIDFCNYLLGEPILTNVKAMVFDTGFSLIIPYIGGSSATIFYTFSGNKELDKEYIEVYSRGDVYKIYDFKRLVINNIEEYRIDDKGHYNELEVLYRFLTNENNYGIDFNDFIVTMKTTFKVDEVLVCK
ncbi:MAG: bi-domain-containing oxidoreductase, partial [bacterium]|nr:bi-domain-containing oxidoreductase [bacterium]